MVVNEFYDDLQVIADVSMVKPPIFDLILFLVVLAYLGVIGGCMYWVRGNGRTSGNGRKSIIEMLIELVVGRCPYSADSPIIGLGTYI